jgi:coenzyme F420-reducing hydrogenase gamma subunit
MPVGGPLEEQVTPDSAARAGRRHKRKEYESMAASRSNTGHKPNQLHVKPGGYVDQASKAKNAWDDAIRSLVPRMLDMSVIEWEGQRPESLEKLREALDLEFEYLGCPLSIWGFRDAVKRFMKTERSRLKGKYLAGDTQCPLHIQPSQWENLQTYWGNSSQVQKAEKMAIARRQVNNASHLGRKGKGGRDADLVRHLLAD